MVKIRVTVTVLPEDVYLAAQDGHLNSAARSARARKFMVSCESPETWTIGQLANKVKDAFSKTYRGEDLGAIKYIKDEDDADLHTDLSVYDALVNAGAEAMNIYDQRTKITVIQEHGFPLRGSSVLPDLSAPQYQIPRPPPPPLFSNSLQAQSNQRKRSSDTAFGGDGFSAHQSGIPPNQRPRLPTISLDHAEYAPVESVEHDTLEDDHVPNRGREVSVDVTKDSQLPTTRRAANVGHKMADYRALADVKPKSESPDPRSPPQRLNPTSRFSLEVPESVTATSENLLKQTSSNQSEGRDDDLEKRCDNRTQRQSPRGYGPIPTSRQSSASRRVEEQATASIPEVVQSGPTKKALLQKQVKVQMWHKRPNAPITPPSDASPADTRGRLTLPLTKSLSSSVRAASTANRFKPTGPRRDVFEPQSSIEDSQMSLPSPHNNKADIDVEVTSTSKGSNSSQSISTAGNANVPFSETVRPYDRDTPILSGKCARNEPVYNFSETLSFLGDDDDYQPQSYRGIAQDELGPAVAVHDMLNDELSTDQSMAEIQEKNEGHSKISSLPEYSHSHPPMSDGESISLSRGRSAAADRKDNDSSKENDHNSRKSDLQVHEPILDTDMEDTSLEEGVDLSTSDFLRPNERFESVEISKKGKEVPTNSRNKDLTTIDILNGGDLRWDTPDMSGNITESKATLGTSLTRSVGLHDNASITAGSHKTRPRRKKSHIKDNIPQLDTSSTRLRSENDKEAPAGHFVDHRHTVLGETVHNSNHANPRSKGQTPTSTGSAGDQLQASLQASTQDRLSSRDAAMIPCSSSFSALSVVQFDICPIINKVYEGVILAFEADNARVAIKGIQNEPHGSLHRNAIFEHSVKGPLSRVLSLQQLVKVKVTKIKNKEIKLSMRVVDQLTGLVKDALKKDRQLKGVLEHAEKQDQKQSDLATNSNTHSNTDKLEINEACKGNIQERQAESLMQPNETCQSEAPNSGVEIALTTERAETPENEGPSEPHFGLGFTNTPRKNIKRASSIDGADSHTVSATALVRSSEEQAPIGFKDAPSANFSRTGRADIRDASTPQSGAILNFSAARSKTTSRKFHSKTKLREKQSKFHQYTEGFVADVEQDISLPQDDSNVSRDQPNLSFEENASLLTRATATAKTEVASEKYISFPPTMTREQYLTQRQANAEAIARRDAAAGEKAGVATSSEPTKAQLATQSVKSTVKKQKDKPVDLRPLSAAFETPPPTVQPAEKRTPKYKQHTTEQNSSGAGPEVPNHTQKQLRSRQQSVSRQQSKNVTAPPTKLREIAKSQNVEPASTEPSALDSQATATPTPPRSVSPNPIKASNTTPYGKTTKSSSKPKAQVTDKKAQIVKPVTAKSTQPRTPFNSKALSLAELRARKEAAKKSAKALSSALTSYKSTPSVSALRTALRDGADSDESESASESESSSDDTQKQKPGAAALKKKAFQRAVSRPDPTIRDRSMSVDVDEDDESD